MPSKLFKIFNRLLIVCATLIAMTVVQTNESTDSIAGSGGSGIFHFDANNQLVEENYSSGEEVAYAYDRQCSVRSTRLLGRWSGITQLYI